MNFRGGGAPANNAPSSTLALSVLEDSSKNGLAAIPCHPEPSGAGSKTRVKRFFGLRPQNDVECQTRQVALVVPCHPEALAEGSKARVKRFFGLCPQNDEQDLLCHLERSERSSDNSKGFFSRKLHQNDKKGKQAAFTMAEVLITLGLIGIVAAMTIPQLIKNYQIKVLQTEFKKAYADLNTASKMFQVRNGTTVSDYAANAGSMAALNLFKKEFNAVLKTNDNVDGTRDEEGNWIGAKPYKGKDGKWYGWGIIGNRNIDLGSGCDVTQFFFDGIGRPISFDDKPASGKNGPKVCIDINGEKSPNIYGVDFFVFLFTTDGYVIPWGQTHKDNQYDGGSTANNSIPNEDMSQYCNNKSKDDSRSAYYSCAIYALSNTHPTDSHKDYWHDFINGR